MRETWSPWQELSQLVRAVDRAVAAGPPVLAPAVRVEENDLGWRVRMDVPGVAPDDLTVEQRGPSLRVAAVRRDGGHETRVERSLDLPSTADPERVEARLEHGVLTLAVPRAERHRPRRLEIRTGRAVVEGGEPAAIAAEAGR